jgi:hypothetical protein
MVEMTGVSLKLDDKRVDKKLEKEGYHQSTIFYSPIQTWVLFIVMLSATSIPANGGVFYLLFVFPIYTTIYFLVSYLFAAYLNNSFIITKDKKELLVINRNFPFYKFKTYQSADIETIRIDKAFFPFLSPLIFFCIVFTHYVEIQTSTGKHRFYCVGLDTDCYDENWTERTLDDLPYALPENVKVIMNL